MKNQILKLTVISLLLASIKSVQAVEVVIDEVTYNVSEDMAEVLEIVLADQEQDALLGILLQSIIEGKILEQRKANWISAYKTACLFQAENRQDHFLRELMEGFTEREEVAFKYALEKGLKEEALLEFLEDLYGRF